VVPVLNEAENIASLLKEIEKAGESAPISEIIYVDDGSTDSSFDVLRSLRKDHRSLRVIRHDRRSGQSAALMTGIRAAGNDLIVTLDGDGQNDPADIPILYERYRQFQDTSPKAMIVGQRAKRNDNRVRRISSRIANAVRSGILKDNTIDTGCSLKLFRRKDFLALPYFDHMHRFLPALMLRDKVRLVHVPVSHRARTRGVSKYGTFDRLRVGIADLWGVWWLMQRPYAHPDIYEDLSEHT
jgi:dolichol-phosphate mannosyltransferase